MLSPSFVLLHVESPEASAAFYARLLALQPVEQSPTFALFALPNGLMLGLWSRHTVAPAAAVMGGAVELAFKLDSDAALDDLHAHWQALGMGILQAPTRMEFGYTLTGADPDGHRLRAFCPAP